MVPGKYSLSHELVRDPRWRIWFCDSTAVVLQRSDDSISPAFNADSAERKLSDCSPLEKK
jgi:hypothetical protein